MVNVLTPIVIPAVKEKTAVMIFLHGLGDSGSAWKWVAEKWRQDNKFDEVEFIFPSAAPIPITLSYGMKLPAWFNISSLDKAKYKDDSVRMLAVRDFVNGLLDEQIKAGIPAHRILLGGFSQGGCISMFVAGTYPQRICGVFCLSAWLIMHEKLKEMNEAGGSHKPPAFIRHGLKDPMVKIEWARATVEAYRASEGIIIDYKEMEGLAHSTNAEEIAELEQWVEERLKESESASSSA